MSIAPDEQPPLEEVVETPLKQGKRYGVLLLMCGLYPILTIAFIFLVVYFSPLWYLPAGSFLGFVILTPIFFSPLFVIAGIVFGILGRRTEGERYATTGLVLSSLIALPVFALVALLAYGNLFPCC